MITNKEAILCELLDCGTADLELLEDINYDVCDIANDLMSQNILSFNNILTEVFIKGVSELEKEIYTRKRKLQNKIDKDEYEEQELEIISELDPEYDIEWWTNYLDSGISFINNAEIYREFFSKEIDNIEYQMGFNF